MADVRAARDEAGVVFACGCKRTRVALTGRSGTGESGAVQLMSGVRAQVYRRRFAR